MLRRGKNIKRTGFLLLSKDNRKYSDRGATVEGEREIYI